MKIKQMKKAGKCMAVGAVALTLLFSGNAYCTELYAAEAEQMALENVCDDRTQTFSTKYACYYKVENGYRYVRVRDESRGKWVTPWILCP